MNKSVYNVFQGLGISQDQTSENIMIDSKARALTVEDSNTNKAHSIWYNKLTPMQRFNLSNKFEGLSLNKRLNACLNHIEDNINAWG